MNLKFLVLPAQTIASAQASHVGRCTVEVTIVAGPIGKTYRVEYTEDLQNQSNWQLLKTVTLTNSPQLIIDENSPAEAKRFYRATAVE